MKNDNNKYRTYNNSKNKSTRIIEIKNKNNDFKRNQSSNVESPKNNINNNNNYNNEIQNPQNNLATSQNSNNPQSPIPKGISWFKYIIKFYYFYYLYL